METKGEKCALSDIAEGAEARVLSLGLSPSAKRRLCDLGFCPGERILCLGRGPLGDPRAYLARDRIVALRQKDAAKVECLIGEEA